MNPLDAGTIRAILEEAADTVRGDWILIGGTVLPLLAAGHRSTLDIDLIPLEEVAQSEVLELMGIAERMGLPVETINQAGGYFLKRIPDFREHLVLLHEGTRARIFRPDPTLYVLLKLPRLSESDLEDCVAYLQFADRSGEDVDAPVLRESVSVELREAGAEGRKERLERLLRAI